jgi:TonB family protein
MTSHCVVMMLLTLGVAAASQLDPVYRSGDGVQPAKIVHRVEPHYTPQARREMIQGIVVLEVVVDENGEPGRISVLSPLGFGLDERAIQAVSRWKFEAGTKDGKPVATIITAEVNFRIFHHWFDPTNEERRTAFNLAVDEIQRNMRAGHTLDTIRNLAQQKYPPAMYLYAKMLEAGDGYPLDPDLAFRLILDASDRHYPAAMYEVGRMMMDGRRMAKDPERGLELVRNAAVLRNRRAQFFLGAAYASGDRVPRDTDRAAQYFRMCAAAGETPCQVQLAKILLDRPDREQRDLVQAIAWLELSAERGDPEAKLMLDQNRGSLSAKDISWVSKIKPQLTQY